ncbi:MAG: adenine phosphoribosyltransferase [Candidatus Gastranaerophilales bacterium]|nr:adenine phosphoribosyltransferase [Candidatus Gastranaerophilales bacterium]
MTEYVKSKIRSIPDFPKKGILFKDITTAIKDTLAFKQIVDFFTEQFKDMDFDYIATIESRGFFLGAPIAYLMGKGLVLIRKPGKLPAKVHSAEYTLEYGSDKLEIHADALKKGSKVIIMDDLLATGGTLGASMELIERSEAQIVASAFVMELQDLKAREKFDNKVNIISMIKY